MYVYPNALALATNLGPSTGGHCLFPVQRIPIAKEGFLPALEWDKETST